MLIFVLRKATLPNRINSVPWMNAVTPTPYHECTEWVWIKVALRSRQTACIHGTELVWPHSLTVRSWCDHGHSWFGVDVTASIHGTELVWFRKVIPRGSYVHCTVEIHLADFFLFVFHQWWKNLPNFNIRTQPWPMSCKTGGNLVKRRQLIKSTLRSWCNLVEWPYGVKKISIKWLLPVKVTLEVIKRHPKVFCWSCDEDPLKWEKNLRSIQFFYYGSNEPTLTSQFKWSVNSFNFCFSNCLKVTRTKTMHTGHNFQIASSGHLRIFEKAAFLLKSILHTFSRPTTQHVGELLASMALPECSVPIGLIFYRKRAS
jgi:hypothetical protein